MGLAGQASWGRSRRIDFATALGERHQAYEPSDSPGLAEGTVWFRNGSGSETHCTENEPTGRRCSATSNSNNPAEQGPRWSLRLALLIDSFCIDAEAINHHKPTPIPVLIAAALFGGDFIWAV
jgi:hypothetical protein